MAYYLLLLLCALIAIPQISVSLPGQHLTVDEAADRALTLHSAGATDEAIKLLTSAVKQAPAHFEASFRLGSLLHVQGRFVEAIAAYEVALALNPTVAVAHGTPSTRMHTLWHATAAATASRPRPHRPRTASVRRTA